jgi:alkyl hydroperoxide reductase subunit AhpF
MPLLTEDLVAQLKEEFQQLVNPVKLVVFFQALADPESEQVRRLAEELASLDSRLSIESLNFVLDKERAEAMGVTRTPAIAVQAADKDHGIRFYGMPSGYEFGSLLDAILLVSRGESGLSPETEKELQALPRDVQIQVFSTPT